MVLDITNTEIALRVLLLIIGLWIAGHHFCAANALRRAPKFVKNFILPCTVGAGVGMAWATVFYGSGVALLFALPMVVFMSVTEAIVWNAGMYMSDALDRREAMKLVRRKQP